MRRIGKAVSLYLEEELFLVIVGLVAAAFIALGRVRLAQIPRIVEPRLLYVLVALLIAVELVRDSGLLDRSVVAVVSRFHTARGFTLAMIAVTGALSALVTNDVALFVVIPFTVLARNFTNLGIRNAVILEVIAANLIGCLTPLGNPQNLFLHHLAGWPASRFLATMLPFVAWGCAGLVAAVFLLEPRLKIEAASPAARPIRWAAASAGLTAFLLVVLEISGVITVWPALAVSLLAAVLFLRRGLFDIDLSIVPLFFFAFIIVAGLRSFEIYHLLAPLAAHPGGLYASAILLSQFISNVPATVLVAPLAHGQWKLLLYAVNAGGCGTLIASLANLLGWRIYLREHGPDPDFLHRMLTVSFLFLGWTAAGGWLLL